MNVRKLHALWICALVALVGCKALETHENSARLIIQYSTLKYIEKAGDAPAQAARAGRVRSVAEQAMAMAAGGNVILSALEASIRAEVAKLTLSPADRMLADGLISVVAQELSRKFGEGVLSEQQLVQTRAVLSWVIEATAYSAA